MGGVILFFCFYVLRSGMSNIYQVMGTVWKWPWEYVLKVQYFNVAGSLLGIVISYFLFTRGVGYKKIFITAFAILAGVMLWFSYLFYPDTTVRAIGPALFIEGVGKGILMTPLVFFMIGAVHPSISISASQVGTATRFWTSIFGFALMQNLVFYLSTKYQFLLAHNMDVTRPVFQEQWFAIFGKYYSQYLYNDALRLSSTTLKNKVAQQALLLADTEIFTGLFVFGMVILLAILCYRPLKKIILSLK